MTEEQMAEFGKLVKQEFEAFVLANPELKISRLTRENAFFEGLGGVEYLDIVENIDDKCKAEASVTLRMDSDGYYDDEGSRCQKNYFSVEMSWPSWSSTNMSLAMRRIKLFQKVGEFCVYLQEKFSYLTVCKVLFTKEQLEESDRLRNIRLAQETLTRKVKCTALPYLKNLRVGKSVTFEEKVEGIVPGETYEFKNGYGEGKMREFSAIAQVNDKFTVIRTA